MRERLRSAGRVALGVAIGAATAFLDLGFVVVAGLGIGASWIWPRAREIVLAGARSLAGFERRRVARYLGEVEEHEFTGWQAMRYLALRWVVGLLGLFVLFLLGFGLAVAGSMLLAWTTGFPWSFVESGGRVTAETIALAAIPGAVLLYLDLAGIAGVAGLDRTLVRRILGPNANTLLQQRVSELSESRALVVEAVDDERRRIERDLHDGVQQRLVALGMLLGRARRSQSEAKTAELLVQAHEESQQALHELREVSWRVYPAALDQQGLAAALENVADRSSVPVELDFALAGRPPRNVEAVAYFVVCEAVTNAAKHAGAHRVDVAISQSDKMIHVRIADDGVGGADPAGGGLAGLARRVAALDGTFAVASPAGGGTTVTAELPCG